MGQHAAADVVVPLRDRGESRFGDCGGVRWEAVSKPTQDGRDTAPAGARLRPARRSREEERAVPPGQRYVFTMP